MTINLLSLLFVMLLSLIAGMPHSIAASDCGDAVGAARDADDRRAEEAGFRLVYDAAFWKVLEESEIRVPTPAKVIALLALYTVKANHPEPESAVQVLLWRMIANEMLRKKMPAPDRSIQEKLAAIGATDPILLPMVLEFGFLLRSPFEIHRGKITAMNLNEGDMRLLIALLNQDRDATIRELAAHSLLPEERKRETSRSRSLESMMFVLASRLGLTKAEVIAALRRTAQLNCSDQREFWKLLQYDFLKKFDKLHSISSSESLDRAIQYGL